MIRSRFAAERCRDAVASSVLHGRAHPCRDQVRERRGYLLELPNESVDQFVVVTGEPVRAEVAAPVVMVDH
jgi:hypothetical protein